MANKTERSFKRPIAGRTTVSAIIKHLANDRKLKGSTRNLERRFAALVDRFGGIGAEWKDENSHYSIEERNKSIFEAIVLELDQRDNYTDKLLEDKRENVNPEDVIRFFNNVADYTKDKLDEETWHHYLSGLDEDIQYSFWAACWEIFGAINTTILNIRDLPYPHQISIMEELRQEIVLKWAGAIHQELEETIKTKLALLEFERELNEEKADS